jgi:hypothetical protein
MRPTKPPADKSKRTERDAMTRASVTRIIHHAATIAASVARATVATARLVRVARQQLDGSATVQDVRTVARELDDALTPMVSAYSEIDGHLRALADLERDETPVCVGGVTVLRGTIGAC